jgi:hypothetical protein
VPIQYYYPKIFIKSRRQIMCGSNFYESDVIWDVDIQAWFFCRNNGRIMENMEKGLTIPKWVLINRPEIPQVL